MLTKVVLPAPLVPIRPTTESFSIAAQTSAAAVTAPKVLHNPCASRMADTAEQGQEPFGKKNNQDQQRDAEAHLPRVGREVIRHGVDRAVDQRADERREHVAGAREDGDEDEF